MLGVFSNALPNDDMVETVKIHNPPYWNHYDHQDLFRHHMPEQAVLKVCGSNFDMMNERLAVNINPTPNSNLLPEGHHLTSLNPVMFSILSRKSWKNVCFKYNYVDKKAISLIDTKSYNLWP